MGHADQHELVHQIDNVSGGHKFLLEGFDAEGESGTVHQHGAFGR